MRIIIATGNKDKVLEFSRILRPLGVDAVSMKDAGIVSNPDETGTTFAENAFIKAEAVHCLCPDDIIVSDDSGLCVDALGGMPGVYSSRFMGENASYDEKIDAILSRLEEKKAGNRTARYVCAICCILPDGKSFTTQGECVGKIGFKQKGTGGFGYDPIFICGTKTCAEMTPEEKDKISHRGKALREFAAEFKNHIEEIKK